MEAIPLSALFGALACLLVLSGFFSGSETGLMALNRYRTRHLARGGHRGAGFADKLLRKPDRLIGLILLGNNLINFTASSLATLIALRLGGEGAIGLSVVLFTLTVLIFSEVAPKTMAALNPERIAYPAAYVYTPLLKVLWPVVWVVNVIANAFLRLFGVRTGTHRDEQLSQEELRTVVLESGTMIPKRHRRMLLSILDLEQVTVEDIMIPRNDIAGIDLNDDWDTIRERIHDSRHSRMPVFEESIDDIVGMLHLRRLIRDPDTPLDVQRIREQLEEPYFVPEGTPLQRQLLNFQSARRRVGLVVDEYGDIQGLVTLEDILEEIVGEFTTDPAASHRDLIRADEDGNYLVSATAGVRLLNRRLGLELPTEGPKTLNGLILEHMEAIPEPGTSVKLAGYPVEIVQTTSNAVKTVRLKPRLATTPSNT